MKSACGAATAWLLVFVWGCGSPKSPPLSAADQARLAIQQVLERHAQLAQQRDGALATANGTTQAALILERNCGELQRIDLSGCPADFRVAFRQHIAACQELQAAVRQYPDGFAQGLIVGSFNNMMGEQDGGYRRLSSAVMRAMENAKAHYREVERIGAKYGAAL